VPFEFRNRDKVRLVGKKIVERRAMGITWIKLRQRKQLTTIVANIPL